MAKRSQYVWPRGFAFRTPLLPLTSFTEWARDPSIDSLRATLKELIDSKELADALFVASPDLFESIDAWRDEPDSIRGQRVERSLTRYFSRMAGRATPFGLFAAVSVGTVASQDSQDPDRPTQIDLPERLAYQRSTRLDNDYLFALCDAASALPNVRANLEFFPNSSLYIAGGRLRYAEARLDGRTRSHHLVAVERTSYLEETVERARGGATLESLATALADSDPEIEIGEARGFIAELVDTQILVSRLSPNVTGKEPIHHCIAQFNAAGAEAIAQPLEEARESLRAIDAIGLGAPPGRYRAVAEGLGALPAKVELNRLFQVDMTMVPKAAHLGRRVMQEIERAVLTLESITTAPAETPLSKFRDEFVSRYESREVPLELALDEEVGIGFRASQAPAADAAPLLAGLAFPPDPDQVRQVSWSGRDDHLLELITRRAASGGMEVALEKRDIAKLRATKPARLPAAFSIMATVVADSAEQVDRGNFQLIAEGASGPSGARILGRFCLASKEHDELVREHIAAEETHLEDAIFAEIVHLPEGRIGNVLCRPVLRTFEIPYLGVSGADSDKQLATSDLLVSVRRQRVVLRSKTLDREVIPRLSTAHNFNLRSLGVYRFLCSLQDQGSSYVGWSWGALQGASFLPRIRFGRHILARARWRLTEEDLEPLAKASQGAKKATSPEAVGALRNRINQATQTLREQRQLPRFVVLADGDNELPIDFENALSVDSFAALVKSRGGATLTELYPPPDKAIATSPQGRHHHQIVVPMTRVAEPKRSSRGALPTADSGRFLPGSEWLYVKLYTGSSPADDVLRELIWPTAQRLRSETLADRWFFVRYGDPDWHLRVRFHGDPTTLRTKLLPLLEQGAARLRAEGLVDRMQIDTYKEETARYGGPVGTPLLADLFCADSEAVCEIVDLIDGDEGEIARWQLCARGIDSLLDDLGFDLPQKRELMNAAKEGFAAEFHADTPLRKELGKRFRQCASDLEAVLARDPAIDADHPFEPGFAALAKRSATQRAIGETLRRRESELTRSLGDIALSAVHMHANRLLRSAHRAQEMVLYDFLKRYYDRRVNTVKNNRG